MFQQNHLKNHRRKITYPGPGAQFYIPKAIWEQTLVTIRRYGLNNSEGFVFWGGGIGASGEAYITTVYLPNHPPQGSRAHPAPNAMRQLVRSLHSADQKLLAQVHSHPGEAYHSYGDDQNAASYHPGYISIVIPDFGKGVTTLRQCEIYEFDGRTISRIHNSDVLDRFVFEELVVELTSKGIAQDEPIWKKLSKKLKFIGHKKL